MTRTEVQIISDGYIVTNDLSNGCVTTAKLNDFAITTGKIANQAVTASKLASDIQFFPAGGIVMWSGSEVSIPTGWVLCNGQNSTPDLRDRFIVGAGSGGSYTVGTLGGANSVQLNENQLPSHTHTMANAGSHAHTGTTSGDGSHSHSGDTGNQSANHTHTGSTTNNGNHNHSYTLTLPQRGTSGGGARDGANPQGGTTGDGGSHSHSFTTNGASSDHSHSFTVGGGGHSHTVSINSAGDHSHTINSTGGGNAHENRPPFYALCFIMKS